MYMMGITASNDISRAIKIFQNDSMYHALMGIYLLRVTQSSNLASGWAHSYLNSTYAELIKSIISMAPSKLRIKIRKVLNLHFYFSERSLSLALQ
jgi:histone acetyltransferase (RNA polymerase elongator complex component)